MMLVIRKYNSINYVTLLSNEHQTLQLDMTYAHISSHVSEGKQQTKIGLLKGILSREDGATAWGLPTVPQLCFMGF